MCKSLVKYFFTQNKIFFYGLGGWVVALGSGLAVVGLRQLPVNEPVCRVGYIYGYKSLIINMYIIVQCSAKPTSNFLGTTQTTQLAKLINFW